ncbi:MAG: IS30 family transposase [Bacteroidales bacterium]|jgi:IS30 family transposase
MKYKHLRIEEREKIQELFWQKKSIRYIAKTLDRSPTSISRELRRNFPDGYKRYTPRLAHERALFKRRCRGRAERLKTKEIKAYVIKHLRERWSPEQIAGRIKIDLKQTISHEAIYQFIYYQIHRDGYGYLKTHSEDLRIYLRRKQKRRQKKGTRKGQRIFKPNGFSIDERPKIVADRKRIGDWESDSVESINHKSGVNTLLERKSGMYLVTKLKNRTSVATVFAIQKRMRNLPNKVKRTMTFDNGSENRDWKLFEEVTSIKSYFAHPYHSWERGSNENANGLLRDYFPKKTDFSTIPEEEILKVEYSLNSRPRKRLGWKTPLEVFSVALRG